MRVEDEHLRHILQGDIVSKGNSRRERVPGHMNGQPLVYPTQSGYLFQEFVHLLVRRNRETGPFRILRIPVLIFLQNDKCEFQKRDIAGTAFLMSGYLYASLVYPQFSLIVLVKMCRAQGLHINVRQAGQTTEQEKILHGVQTCRGKVLLHNPFQFLREICGNSSYTWSRYSGKVCVPFSDASQTGR